MVNNIVRRRRTDPPLTKTLSGKIYSLQNLYSTPSGALRAKQSLKKRGYSVRVMKYSGLSRTRKGRKTFEYAVYTRKG